MVQQVRAPLGSALALLLSLSTLSTLFARELLIAGIVVTIGLLAWGWPRLLELPAPRSATFLIAASGLSALGVGWLLNTELSLEVPISVVMAIVFFLCIMREMLRPSRHRLTLSLSGTVVGCLFSLLCVTWLQAFSLAQASPWRADALFASLTLGLCASLAVLALPGSGKARVPGSIIAGAVMCSLMATVFTSPILTILLCGAMGAVVAGVAVSTHYLMVRVIAAYDNAGYAAVGAAPVAVAGVAVLLFMRAGIQWLGLG
ncbi:hypothetical protein MHY20_08765 [Helcobacillus sp. ACRRO]|uniref:hypothetical protein n=1 Tax=Helcobacillus TaxID=1161125 RepID=UPI001EF6FF10|nr:MULTISPECIES: hypothetical protein [Helcobacillus]MCG7427695.1 hypothetical protein [Helcobacillus sp. ACRRO]MDK7741985.1 hypothetical protein [Helcobacillus massiliensis]WOO93104.1 hypothetical protein R3I40_00470 [Helcobacillus massiliensis]